jgi:DNA-binding NarL/FixJ family response regulator
MMPKEPPACEAFVKKDPADVSVCRIALVDDHSLVRSGIRSLLEKLPGIRVVGEASDGRSALELIRVCRPDIVLMDIAMPRLNGMEALNRVACDFPAVKVLILSGHSNEEYVLQALRAGASGYLLKDSATSELQFAIDSVRGGQTYLSPAVSKTVIERYRKRTKSHDGVLSRLTPRQREILQLLAEGNNTKEIASLLEISTKTVETHRMLLMVRLDIHDVPGLVRFAIRSGLVSDQT